MNAHTPAPTTAEPAGGMNDAKPPVSPARVYNAAYALSNAAFALRCCIGGPISQRVAREEYEAAIEDMRALLEAM